MQLTEVQLKAVELSKKQLERITERGDGSLSVFDGVALSYFLHEFLKAEPKVLSAGDFWKLVAENIREDAYKPERWEKTDVAELVLKRHDLETLWKYEIGVKN